MIVLRGDVWLANLNPTMGSEQYGIRPVIILQNDFLSKYTSTVLTVPLTTNIKRASLPSCILIPIKEGGLSSESVALCHQLRVLDKQPLQKKLGVIKPETLLLLEQKTLFTFGIFYKNPT